MLNSLPEDGHFLTSLLREAILQNYFKPLHFKLVRPLMTAQVLNGGFVGWRLVTHIRCQTNDDFLGTSDYNKFEMTFPFQEIW